MSTNINSVQSSIKNRYRPDIDGLRAFAVITVIINHFNKDILPGGYLGVDIFFVISGFVITSSLYQRPNENFKDFISGFFERRIKRLIPALSVFVLLTSIAICLFNREPIFSLRTGITSLLGLSNMYLLKQSTNYFAPSTELNVFTHTWSLGVEEQFYILFPFLIWFSGFGRQTKNGTRNLFLIIAILTVASLMGFLYLYIVNQPAAYFLMPSRFWEMAAGCLIFLGLQKSKSIEKFFEKVPPIFPLILIIGVMYLPKFLAIISTIAVVVLVMALIACLKKTTTLEFKIFSHPKVVFLGLISYSLYLWHWGVLSISRWTIGIHWWSIPIQVVVMFGLAVASYRWVETPIKKYNYFGKRLKTFLVGGGVLIVVSSGLVALGKPLKGKLYTGNKQSEKLITSSNSFDKSAEGYNGRNCHFNNKDFDISLSLKNCLLQSDQKQTTFFFAGNSHTNHHRALHYKLHKENNVNIFSATINVCDFLGDNCKNNSQSLIKNWILDNLKQGDVVVISNRNESTTENKNSWLFTRSSIEAINKFNRLIVSKGGKVILFAPTPEFKLSMEQCRPDWFRPFPNSICKRTIEEIKKEKSKVYFLMNNYLDKKIMIYDPIPDICFEGICPMIDRLAKPLYVDDDHLTDYANTKYLFPGFLSFLKKEHLL